jgi:small-conductance mechanosensitive channel
MVLIFDLWQNLGNILSSHGKEILFQLAFSFAIFCFSLVLSRLFKKSIMSCFGKSEKRDACQKVIKKMFFPGLWFFSQFIFVSIYQGKGDVILFARPSMIILGAWFIYNFLGLFITDIPTLLLIGLLILSGAILKVFGLLNHILFSLDSIVFSLGDVEVSILSFFKGMILAFLMVWVALIFSRSVEKRIQAYSLEASLQVLFTKSVRIISVFLAIFITLGSVGINISTFAVFGGAIAVGIGFGLQKVVSNLVCGVILLLDRSIKPGDVIALKNGSTYGIVNKLSARFVSVRTRSGEEHLIPNEDIITQKVENWSYSDSNIRLKIPVNISYDSDVRKAMDLMLEGSKKLKRVLSSPSPGVRLKSLEDSSVLLELRIWIGDPNLGVSGVRSEALLMILQLFAENGIRIPFPQRDVHIKTPKD